MTGPLSLIFLSDIPCVFNMDRYITRTVKAATHLPLEMTVLKIFSDMPARHLVCNLAPRGHAENICVTVISNRSCLAGDTIPAKHLINGVLISVKLYPHHAPFSLMSETEYKGYKIIIDQAVLMVRYMEVSPATINSHSTAMDKGDALY